MKYLTWRTTIGTSRRGRSYRWPSVSDVLVHRDLVRFAVCSHGLVKEALRRSHVALGREQKGDSISLPVDGAIEIFSDALDLDVGLIHAPASADRALVFAGHFFNERQETNRPPVDRRMLDRHTTLFQHLLDVPATQRVSRISADADQNHASRSTHPFKVEHLGSS